MIKVANLILVVITALAVMRYEGVFAIAGFGNGALPRATPSTSKGQITSLIQELCQRHPSECKAILAKSIRRELVRLESEKKRVIESNLRKAVALSLQEPDKRNSVEEPTGPRFEEDNLDLFTH